ncbi:MAG: HAD-IA family hydrolase [Anaerolineales bacterium]|nr:HAD-IA family hydrolase [Anaerolineales bacterium]
MIKVIIWDLDGVLVDARELHYEALNRALGRFGYTITRDEHLSTFDGLPTNQKLQMLTELKGLPKDLYDKIWKEKQTQTREIIDKEFTYDERMRSILRQLKTDGYRMVVCSNSIRESTKMMLIRKGLFEFMEFFISNQDVRLPKPNPEMFLRAMVKLGVGPKECVIVEDSHHGRQAAFDAGAHLCAVENVEDVTYEKIRSAIDSAVEKNSNGKFVPKWQGGNLRVVIPMAGEGKSFQAAGYVFPKPLIDINGKPMIQWVVENINVDGKFIFIVQKKHLETYNMQYLLNLIAPGCKIVSVEDHGRGAAESVLRAKHLFNDNNPIAIINSDQLISWNSNEFFYAMAADECDGGIVTFKSTHPKWSFVRTGDDGFATEVAEKKPISNLATAGVYYFKKGNDFIKYAEQMIASDIRTLNEFYICPVYNEYIRDGKKIRTFSVKKMWSFSTPKDVEFFMQKYDQPSS